MKCSGRFTGLVYTPHILKEFKQLRGDKLHSGPCSATDLDHVLVAVNMRGGQPVSAVTLEWGGDTPARLNHRLDSMGGEVKWGLLVEWSLI